ncbi:MAG: hypothetical protein EAX95_12780 [Candidatus Thorarchaeota archaeon]|nr:hypothetical protein [Candidatus Thorarchaeota archaeon]
MLINTQWLLYSVPYDARMKDIIIWRIQWMRSRRYAAVVCLAGFIFSVAASPALVSANLTAAYAYIPYRVVLETNSESYWNLQRLAYNAILPAQSSLLNSTGEVEIWSIYIV